MDNKGFSLVELIVVIAISSIVIAGVSMGVSVLFSKDAESLARQIDDQLTTARMMAMSKPGETVMTVKFTSGTISEIEIARTYTDGGSDITKTDVIEPLRPRVSVEYGSSDVSTSMEFKFDKSNGSLTMLKIDGSDELSDSKKTFSFKTSRNGNTKDLILMPVTGRHYVE